MFQDTADMPGMGNDSDRSKKKLEEQEIINQEKQKNHKYYICIQIVLQYAVKSFALLLHLIT